MRDGIEETEQSPFSAMDLLVANIKEVTGLSYWNSARGGHILHSEADYVLVHANREMQQRIDQFLEDLGRFVGASPGVRRRR